MAKILIIDDDKMVCDTLSQAVKGMGHEAEYALTLGEGMEKATSGHYDVVFLDVRLPDGSGLEALPRIRELPLSPEVIIITGYGDPSGAELAIKSGAWDYMEKPLSLKVITFSLMRALQYRDAKKGKRSPLALKLEGIVGSSPKMKVCYELLAQAAGSDANVLITGETGTGKELFARAIHNNSSRAKKSFVVIDCTALPATLVESMLFGYEKGAFTGADRSQDGLIKEADGGTLFLDEVGELPLSLQKPFLRVLQEKTFRPIGSKKEIRSDFRLIAATNRDLDKMVEAGRFRKDLLYRLRSFIIEIPPLREHIEDVKELAIYHMAKLCEHYGVKNKGFSPDFFDALMAYDWPGNVRELINALEWALTVAINEPILFPEHLPTYIRIQLMRTKATNEDLGMEEPTGRPRKELPTLKEFRKKMDRQYLKDLLSLTQGDIKEACRISGLSRSRLYALLKEHQLTLPK
ncbi:MAG: sigma-54-dependent Fis family transcriptional regulator [Deltaproteobacteria bacterium]|nr:MAG: sigma-54-dependent Fis family transcriptional regulator [Deltaproteobacteria bacterium]